MATAELDNPIVAVAAEAREFAGLLSRAVKVERLRRPIRFARRATIGNSAWLLAADGPGPKRAAAAVESITAGEQPRAIVSTGFCGALDESLALGGIFVATRVLEPAEPAEYAARPVGSWRTHASGALVSVDRVAVSACEKKELRAGGGEAVEMEAAAVARHAERCRIPFYCVRVVSDAACEDLPLDFNRFRDRDGRFSMRRIVGAALLRPTLWPALLEFGLRSRHAAQRLGDFLADCRF